MFTLHYEKCESDFPAIDKACQTISQYIKDIIDHKEMMDKRRNHYSQLSELRNISAALREKKDQVKKLYDTAVGCIHDYDKIYKEYSSKITDIGIKREKFNTKVSTYRNLIQGLLPNSICDDVKALRQQYEELAKEEESVLVQIRIFLNVKDYTNAGWYYSKRFKIIDTTRPITIRVLNSSFKCVDVSSFENDVKGIM